MVPELCFCKIVTDFDEWSSNSNEWSSNSDEWSSNSEANWLKQSPPNTILHSFLYSVKLQVILMNGHQNQKQIGRNKPPDTI